MVDFTTLMSSITERESGYSVTVTDDWLQGRTIYGGLSAALCLAAVARHAPDLPPLRSAQFSFIGPATGTLTMTPEILRRGKSTVFVGADLAGEDGLATRAILCFGAGRTSTIRHAGIAAPQVKEPDASPQFFRDVPGLNFVKNFDGRLAAGSFPFSKAADPSMTLWLRHRDDKLAPSIIPLVALTDAPPPASIILFETFARISTMTWSIDMLTDQIETGDGWWLVRTSADNAADGYSSQSMTVWNSERKPIMVCRQNIAIFV
ncbi:MAG: thioesterase family protein [Afipia sp.]